MNTTKAIPKETPSINAKYLIAPVVKIAKEPRRRVADISSSTTCFLEILSFNSWWWRWFVSFILSKVKIFFGFNTNILLIMTYMKSINGSASNIRVVDILLSAMIARIQIRNPYVVFPEDPLIIFCGGNANITNTRRIPTEIILSVAEKIADSLSAITNIKAKIIREFASTIPGEPAVHLTALIHIRIHTKRIRSPGNTKDC